VADEQNYFPVSHATKPVGNALPEQPDFIQQEVAAEVLSFVRQGLQDFSIWVNLDWGWCQLIITTHFMFGSMRCWDNVTALLDPDVDPQEKCFSQVVAD